MLVVRAVDTSLDRDAGPVGGATQPSGREKRRPPRPPRSALTTQSTTAGSNRTPDAARRVARTSLVVAPELSTSARDAARTSQTAMIRAPNGICVSRSPWGSPLPSHLSSMAPTMAAKRRSAGSLVRMKRRIPRHTPEGAASTPGSRALAALSSAAQTTSSRSRPARPIHSPTAREREATARARPYDEGSSAWRSRSTVSRMSRMSGVSCAPDSPRSIATAVTRKPTGHGGTA